MSKGRELDPYKSGAQSTEAIKYTDYISASRWDSLNESPGYDIKQSDGDFPAMLELCGIECNLSLLSSQVIFWPGVLTSERFLSLGQI